MSLGARAVRGAVWTIGTGIGARAIGVVGTLLTVHYLAQVEYGEAIAATAVVQTAGQLTTVGVGQYVIAHPRAGRDAAFHATVFHLGLGAIAMLAVYLVREPLGPLFDAPTMAQYVPGLVAAGMIERVGFMPERVLVRDMRFGAVSIARSLGELSYTACSLSLAIAGWGAIAIVYGNVARACVRSLMMIARADRRDWLEPTPLRRATTRALLAFGLPVWIGGVAGFASRRWDNLLVSRFFGPAVLADYNLAYNLAEIPASQVGEQIGDVLLPSFARMAPAERARAFVRATGMLAVIMFPLAIGLGAVAPTVVATVFDARWAGVAPMLAALSALAITRPIGWTVGSYVQALGRPRLMMMLEVTTVVAMVVGLSTFGRIGPIAACVAVGVAFAVRALVCLVVVRAVDGTSIGALIAPFVQPLVACVAIVGAVWAVRYGLEHAGLRVRGIPLAAECVAGAMAYVGAMFAIAPARSRELLSQMRRAVGRTPQPAESLT